MAWARGVVLVRFPEGRGRPAFSRPPSGGAWPRCEVYWELRQREPCRVWCDARRHLHPPPPPHLRLQVGGGRGVARRGSVLLAVTLIRCCVGTCPESGGPSPLLCAYTFLLENLRVIPTPLPHPPCRTAAVFRAELGEHVCSAPGKEDRAGAGRPPGPGRENPPLALRRAAECGAYARPASRGLVSICPFCLRVKLAGENPVIRAQPLGEHRLPAPPPPPRQARF